MLYYVPQDVTCQILLKSVGVSKLFKNKWGRFSKPPCFNERSRTISISVKTNDSVLKAKDAAYVMDSYRQKQRGKYGTGIVFEHCLLNKFQTFIDDCD